MVAHASALPPGPKGRAVVGVYPEFRRDPAEFLRQTARAYGDVVYMRIGRQHTYLLSHPDFVRDVLMTNQHRFKKSRMLERARELLGDGLLTSEGAFHRRQRRLMQPAFHRERLAGYAATMVERAAAARDQWTEGQTSDMPRQMMRLTLDIVSRTLFSTDVQADADEIGAAMSEVVAVFETLMLPFSELLEKLPLPAVRRFRQARERLDAVIYRIIAERRASGKDAGDLLSMMLLAQDQEGEGAMTDQQVRDESLTLFLAGHETTALALTWTWYLLSQNAAAEAAFHEEIDRELGGRLPAFDDLPRLRYTTAAFSESLRMYPPAWAIGRRALDDYTVGGFTIPAKSIVLVSPYVVHRDPRWFDDPETFRPERWLTETERPKFSYFPFGGGARVCIGERFAWTEGVLLLATLGQRWRFRLAPNQKIGTRAQITLRPRGPIQMIAEARKIAAAQ